MHCMQIFQICDPYIPCKCVILQAVWITATMPYIVLITLLCRGLELEGAWDGIKFFITPSFEKLGDHQVSIIVWGMLILYNAPTCCKTNKLNPIFLQVVWVRHGSSKSRPNYIAINQSPLYSPTRFHACALTLKLKHTHEYTYGHTNNFITYKHKPPIRKSFSCYIYVWSNL